MPIVVGPRANSRQLVPNLVAQALAGHIQVYRHAMRDLLGVDRLRLLVDELLGRVNDQETVVLASGVAVAVPTIVDIVQELLGTNSAVTMVERGDQQRFRIDKLRKLAPQTSLFDEEYPREVLRRYVLVLNPESSRHRTSHATASVT